MTPVRTPSARERRRAQMRRSLFDALEGLVAGGADYPQVSAEDIARAAGVSRATFYIHFEGKAGLLRAWLADVLEELVASCDLWRGLGPGCSLEQVRAALRVIVTTYGRHGILLAAVEAEAGQDRILREQLEAGHDAAVAGLGAQLLRGQREGWVSSRLPPAESAAWAVCMLERGLAFPPSRTGPADDAVTASLATMLWNAFFAPAR